MTKLFNKYLIWIPFLPEWSELSYESQQTITQLTTTRTGYAMIVIMTFVFGSLIINTIFGKPEVKPLRVVSRDASTNTDISTLNAQSEPSLLDPKTRLANIVCNENISEEEFSKHTMKNKTILYEDGDDKVVEWLNFKSKPYTSTPDTSLKWLTIEGYEAPVYMQPYYKTTIEYKIDTADDLLGKINYLKITEYIPYHPLDYDRTIQQIMSDIVIKSTEGGDKKEYISKKIGNLFDLIQSKQTIYPELDHTNIKLTNWLYEYTSKLTEPIAEVEATPEEIHNLISFISKTKSSETITPESALEPTGIWATFSSEDLIDLGSNLRPRRASRIFELKPIKEEEMDTLVGNIKEEIIIHKSEIASDWLTDIIMLATEIKK